jgi:hypothetical protein
MEWITEKQLNMAISRQFNSNIKKYGRSLSKGTMHSKINHFVEEIRTDNKMILMRDNWREHIKFSMLVNYDYS